jgi:uncharacterized protein (DUF362 family)/ferredoxin
MGCSGSRAPENRLTTHPLVAEAIISALLDCGAKVSFGDDVSRSGKYVEPIQRATGMWDVAKRTGASLVDFVSVGAREVRSGLLYPRKYLVTNAYFDADVVVNAASCRSHVGIGLSGAMKNMFGCLIGLRKQLIHNLFPCDSRGFCRAIADIYRLVRPTISFLDLTTVAEAAGITLAVRPVGIMLAGTDGVALDTLAAHAIGYEALPMWTAHYGNEFGAGCNSIDQISVRGLDWQAFPKVALRYPAQSPSENLPMSGRMTAVVNNTALRPRPIIASKVCVGCGDCVQRCPVGAIGTTPNNAFRIDLGACADCGCCLKVCEASAITIDYVGLARAIRILTNSLPEKVDSKPASSRDPA